MKIGHKAEFDVKSILILIIGGVLALYFLGSLLPGASGNLVAANFTSNSVAQAVIVLVVPTFIAVVLLKLFGYI